MHRFAPAKDVPLSEHFSKDPDLRRFELGLQRQVGIFKIAQDTEPLKTVRLLVDGRLGKGGGFFAERHRRERLAFFGFHGLQDFEFNGKTVAVPAGDVVDLFAVQDLLAIDEIFEDFVERVTAVQIAIGVGRTIVQNVALRAGLFGSLGDSVVQINLFPVRLQLGLALGSVGALGKGRFGEKNGGSERILFLLRSLLTFAASFT